MKEHRKLVQIGHTHFNQIVQGGVDKGCDHCGHILIWDWDNRQTRNNCDNIPWYHSFDSSVVRRAS